MDAMSFSAQNHHGDKAKGHVLILTLQMRKLKLETQTGLPEISFAVVKSSFFGEYRVS